MRIYIIQAYTKGSTEGVRDYSRPKIYPSEENIGYDGRKKIIKLTKTNPTIFTTKKEAQFFLKKTKKYWKEQHKFKDKVFSIELGYSYRILTLKSIDEGKGNRGWKYIDGFFGLYQINKQAQCRRVARTLKVRTGDRRIPALLMTPQKTKKGYLELRLKKDGKNYRIFLHRCVAETFIPNPENKPTVNHKNGIKIQCEAKNLEWMTIQQQNIHALETGLRKKQNTKNRHPVKRFTLDGEYIDRFESLQGAVRDMALKGFAVSQGSIYNVCIGVRKSAGGFRWEYADPKNNIKKFRVIVQQFTLDGKLVKEHKSLADAVKESGVGVKSIYDACKGVQKTAGGFKWKTKE